MKRHLLASFDGPARAVHCANAIIHDIPTALIGIHTAKVMLGESSLSGPGVDVASKIVDASDPCRILVSKTVRDLVAGAGIEFDSSVVLIEDGNFQLFRVVS